MPEIDNPYRPPSASLAPDPPANTVVAGVDVLAFVAWPIVMAANMIVPLLLGWDMTNARGRTGVFLAAGAFLASGWALCYCRPGLARRVLLGGAICALTQIVPVLQLIAGVVAVGIAEALGQTTSVDDIPPTLIASRLGGFLVTFLVGTFLLFFALGAGLFFGMFLPQRWFDRRQAMRQSRESDPNESGETPLADGSTPR